MPAAAETRSPGKRFPPLPSPRDEPQLGKAQSCIPAWFRAPRTTVPGGKPALPRVPPRGEQHPRSGTSCSAPRAPAPLNPAPRGSPGNHDGKIKSLGDQLTGSVPGEEPRAAAVPALRHPPRSGETSPGGGGVGGDRSVFPGYRAGMGEAITSRGMGWGEAITSRGSGVEVPLPPLILPGGGGRVSGAAPPSLPRTQRRIRPHTWCTKTSTGESRVAPPLAVMERKPKPMRTLNHLQMPEPCNGSFSALGESPAGSSPGFAPGEETHRAAEPRGWGNRGCPPPNPPGPAAPHLAGQPVAGAPNSARVPQAGKKQKKNPKHPNPQKTSLKPKQSG